jgi:hypothetical protein
LKEPLKKLKTSVDLLASFFSFEYLRVVLTHFQNLKTVPNKNLTRKNKISKTLIKKKTYFE